MAFNPQFPGKESLWWSLRANVFLEEYNPEGSEEEGENGCKSEKEEN